MKVMLILAVVSSVANRLLEMGCYEISLGDTTGRGTPQTVASMLDHVLKNIPATKLAGHYHDTNQRALENIEVSLERGIRRFDSSIGGIGGCPYAPGARGNVATTDVVNLLKSKNFDTGIDQEKLTQALDFVQSLFIKNDS